MINKSAILESWRMRKSAGRSKLFRVNLSKSVVGFQLNL
jgi:hypothetical protein